MAENATLPITTYIGYTTETTNTTKLNISYAPTMHTSIDDKPIDTFNDILTTERVFTDTYTYNYTTEGDYFIYYTDFIYPGYEFERNIYLFIWEILVIVTCLANLIVIIVLTHKNMRSATNMILVAIAVSDSLTGLVTLPSYIAVYQKFEPAIEDTEGYNEESEYSQDGYILDKDLCRYFMISKFFVSKTFHTISIWLTLFLGIQRFISVAYPFKAQVWFSIKNTLTVCAVIPCISPFIHIYHLLDEKAKDGWCQWVLGASVKGGLAYLWITFFFVHLVPCITLVVFTVLFIVTLYRSTSRVENMGSGTSKSLKKRTDDNRRISIVVITIVIVFLIPEVPYGVFLLYSAVLKQTNQGLLDLKTNRAIHAIYELSLVVSFHANFYIYTILNQKFRLTMKRIFLTSINRVKGRQTRFSSSRSSHGSESGKTTQSSVTKTMALEMRPFNS